MRVGRWVRVGREQVETIVEDEEQSDDNALRNFNAIDTREHVDALRTKHGNTSHVNVVEGTKVEEFTEVRLELHGYHNAGNVEVDEVYDEEGNGCEAGNPPFVSPANIEEVVADSEEGNGLE